MRELAHMSGDFGEATKTECFVAPGDSGEVTVVGHPGKPADSDEPEHYLVGLDTPKHLEVYTGARGSVKLPKPEDSVGSETLDLLELWAVRDLRWVRRRYEKCY